VVGRWRIKQFALLPRAIRGRGSYQQPIVVEDFVREEEGEDEDNEDDEDEDNEGDEDDEDDEDEDNKDDQEDKGDEEDKDDRNDKNTLGTRGHLPAGHMLNTLWAQTTSNPNVPGGQNLDTLKMYP